MLYCKALDSEKYDYLNERFRAAYRWLSEMDMPSLPVGKYPIIGDDVYAMMQEYTTVPKEEKRFETHDRFFDIQYMAAGEECFCVCQREELSDPDRNENGDALYGGEPSSCTEIFLREGEMAVVAPEDAHKPGCAVGAPMPVRKVVVKVRI